MEKVTQTTAATAEESAAASEELNAQAETSMQVVKRLESLVGGSGVGVKTVKPRMSRHAHTPAPMSAAPTKTPASVVPMSSRRPQAVPKSDAEAAFPLEDAGSGTYGNF